MLPGLPVPELWATLPGVDVGRGVVLGSAPLASVVRRACERGERVRVLALGGSITARLAFSKQTRVSCRRARAREGDALGLDELEGRLLVVVGAIGCVCDFPLAPRARIVILPSLGRHGSRGVRGV